MSECVAKRLDAAQTIKRLWHVVKELLLGPAAVEPMLLRKVLYSSRNLLRRRLSAVGLRLTRAVDVIDLFESTQNPIEGAYCAGGRLFVLEVPLRDCRILHSTAFACTGASGNPFVESLLLYGRGECLSYSCSPLKNFYQAWQPADAAEALGLARGAVKSVLAQMPALSIVMPWSGESLETSMANRTAIIEKEHFEHGGWFSAASGWKSWGPVDEEYGEFEFKRLTRVYDSIRKRGYRRTSDPNGDITGDVLYRNGETRIMIHPGHHRAAAVTALGFECVPIRLRPVIIRRDDVDLWPHVRSGVFSRDEALLIFDRIFEARQPQFSR